MDLKGVNLRYLEKRVVEVLREKQHRYDVQLQKDCHEKEKALQEAKLEYFKTQPVADVVEYIAWDHDSRTKPPIVQRWEKQSKAMRAELKKAHDATRARQWGEDGLHYATFVQKKREILDKIMLGDSKDAVKVLESLEKWEPK